MNIYYTLEKAQTPQGQKVAQEKVKGYISSKYILMSERRKCKVI